MIKDILSKINNGYDFLKSDYATCKDSENDYENEKQEQLKKIEQEIKQYLIGLAEVLRDGKTMADVDRDAVEDAPLYERLTTIDDIIRIIKES